jgi:DNA topoisomerase-1
LKGILEKLKINPDYTVFANSLLSKTKLYPRQGKKDDPAHPAIYPTGLQPIRIKGTEKKVYDLIVKNFFACLSKPATLSRLLVEVEVNGYLFFLKASETINKGWLDFYKPFIKEKEQILPLIKEDIEIPVTKIHTRRSYTNPPRRYNASSLLRHMENIKIGTKSTRTNIIDTLYKRGYIKGKSIKISELGYSIIETLEDFCSEILSIEMTRELENNLEDIQLGKLNGNIVVNSAKEALQVILSTFKANEKKIGGEIAKTLKELKY